MGDQAMQKGLAAAAAIAASVTAGAAEPPATGQRISVRTTHAVEIAAEQRAIVERDLAAGLRDPESARFGTMVAGGYGDGRAEIMICGMVNAKNAYGGYAGAGPFIGVLYPDRFSLVRMDEPRDTEIVDMLCRKAGLDLRRVR